ncbi:MAG: hypothetical protein GY705_07265 [Bacteroidetes bacterium]|nr:hypothetical protein [Bacteroidota bacterium]
MDIGIYFALCLLPFIYRVFNAVNAFAFNPNGIVVQGLTSNPTTFLSAT